MNYKIMHDTKLYIEKFKVEKQNNIDEKGHFIIRDVLKKQPEIAK